MREAALLRYLQALLDQGRPAMHLHEEAREAGWDDEQILEVVAAVALEGFTAMRRCAATPSSIFVGLQQRPRPTFQIHLRWQRPTSLRGHCVLRSGGGRRCWEIVWAGHRTRAHRTRR